MLKGARREHKTVMEIARFYTDAFFADCRKLNIKTPGRGPACHRLHRRLHQDRLRPHRKGQRLCGGGQRLLRHLHTGSLLCLQRPQRGGPGRGRPGGRGGGHQQAEQERLRPLVHQVQVRGPGAQVGFSLGNGLSRLAHRVLRHLHEVQRRVPGPPLRRRGQRLPPPHQRDRPVRELPGPPLVHPLVPCGTSEHRATAR